MPFLSTIPSCSTYALVTSLTRFCQQSRWVNFRRHRLCAAGFDTSEDRLSLDSDELVLSHLVVHAPPMASSPGQLHPYMDQYKLHALDQNRWFISLVSNTLISANSLS